MGKIIGLVTTRVKGQADGTTVFLIKQKYGI